VKRSGLGMIQSDVVIQRANCFFLTNTTKNYRLFIIWCFKINITSVSLKAVAWNFYTHISTHLGKLFAAVGNTELSYKMVPYMMDQEVFFYQNLLLFWWFLCSCGETKRREFSVRVEPSRDTIYCGLLNSLKKQEVRVINVPRDVNSFVLRSHKVRDLRGHHTENILV
jgi:hypothetical protein